MSARTDRLATLSNINTDWDVLILSLFFQSRTIKSKFLCTIYQHLLFYMLLFDSDHFALLETISILLPVQEGRHFGKRTVSFFVLNIFSHE